MNMQTECTFGKDSCGVTCTGYGGHEAKQIWNAMHEQCNKIGCSICSGHCHGHLDAWEDRIAYEKGKEVKNKANLQNECNAWKCTGDKL